jgi:hypothetical protein
MTDDDHRVRALAHRLWDEAGQPHGRDEEFWHAAVARLAGAPPAAATAPAPAAAKPAPGKPARNTKRSRK